MGYKPKIFYEWGKRELRKIEIYSPNSSNNKPEISTGSKFAKLHDKYLQSRTKRNKK